MRILGDDAMTLKQDQNNGTCKNRELEQGSRTGGLYADKMMKHGSCGDGALLRCSGRSLVLGISPEASEVKRVGFVWLAIVE